MSKIFSSEESIIGTSLFYITDPSPLPAPAESESLFGNVYV